MTERGDVLRVKRRLGFGAERAGERVAVVQATPLNSSLLSTIVVPLDPAADAAPRALAVRVSAEEAGADDDHVAVATHLQVTLFDKLAPGRVGRLRAQTLAELENKIRLVLDL
jgi:mRNA-degrading endonuclease toxin of MazEF toxin-antitoxin module